MVEDYNDKYRELLGIDLGLSEEENARVNEIKNGPRPTRKPKEFRVDINKLPKPQRHTGKEVVNWEFYLKRVREEWCAEDWYN